MSQKILAADIGGTSSRFAVFTAHGGTLTLESRCWLKTGEFNSFEAELKELVQRGFITSGQEPAIVSIGAAGPVEDGVRVKLTQVPWVIDIERLPQELEPKQFRLVNDFVAQAYCCMSPLAAESTTVLSGEKEPDGEMAVVGAGTGLGVAGVLVLKPGHGLALPSEGGHVNYSPESEEEFRFTQFLSKLNNVHYPSWEDALSGRGLQATHEFLTGTKLEAAAIGAGLNEFTRTAEMFARNYGRLCRNLALQYLTSGGIFIAGGIAAKNRILVEHPAFEESFRNSRQHKQFMAKVPVYLQDNEEAGLWGAAQLGWQVLNGA